MMITAYGNDSITYHGAHQAIATKILTELMNSIGNCDKCLVLAEEDRKLENNKYSKQGSFSNN